MNKVFVTFPLVALGFAGGYLLAPGAGTSADPMSQPAMFSGAASANGPCPGGAEPAYWVAPMDANFRRDEPGKSPMGMDLVPFCEEAGGGADVVISPAVVQNLGVRTVAVTVESLHPTVRAVGTVGWNEDTLRHVHTRAEGWVEELGVSAVGDAVAAGEELFALYSPKLYSAEAEYLAANNAVLREAASSRLRALGYGADQVSALRRGGKATERMTRTAAADLTVVELGVRHGQFVTPGTMMMVLADPRRVWLTVQVSERDAGRIRAGQSAEAQVSAWPERRWKGRVEHVYPELDPATRTLRVRLAFDNPDGALMPNMYATVVIDATPADMHPDHRSLVVPASAVIRSGSGARVVRAVGSGRFEVVPVRTGFTQDGRTQILEGLQADQDVVVSGQFLLDSEANVDAESLRLASSDMPMSNDDHSGHDRSGASVMAYPAPKGTPAGMATAEILDLDREGRTVLLQHGDFEPMGSDGMSMPGMTMGFGVAESVDMSELEAGDQVHVIVENPKPGQYTVTEVHRMAGQNHSPGDHHD